MAYLKCKIKFSHIHRNLIFSHTNFIFARSTENKRRIIVQGSLINNRISDLLHILTPNGIQYGGARGEKSPNVTHNFSPLHISTETRSNYLQTKLHIYELGEEKTGKNLLILRRFTCAIGENVGDVGISRDDRRRRRSIPKAVATRPEHTNREIKALLQGKKKTRLKQLREFPTSHLSRAPRVTCWTWHEIKMATKVTQFDGLQFQRRLEIFPFLHCFSARCTYKNEIRLWKFKNFRKFINYRNARKIFLWIAINVFREFFHSQFIKV